MLKLFQSLVFAGVTLGTVLLASLLAEKPKDSPVAKAPPPGPWPALKAPPQQPAPGLHTLGVAHVSGTSHWAYIEDKQPIYFDLAGGFIPFDPNAIDSTHPKGQLLFNVPQVFIDNFLAANPDPVAYAISQGKQGSR